MTGNCNTAVGSGAGWNSLGSGNVFLGCGAGYHETGSDKLYINNDTSSTPLIYGDFSTGMVGINTNNPQEALDINGDTKTQGTIIEKTGGSASVSCERVNFSAFAFGAGVQGGFTVDENYHLEFRSNTRADVLSRFISTGNLLLRFRRNTGWAGFGVGNPATELHVNGSITYNGSLNNASDRRLKKNINSFDYGLNEVRQLNPVTFEYNGKANLRNTDQQHIGLVAQELQQVAPELVSSFTHEEEDIDTKVAKSEDYLMISESSIKYMLINAVKEQQNTIENLEQEVANLKEVVEAVLSGQNTNIDREGTDLNRQAIELNGQGAYLKQNQPNPFGNHTLIQYYVPADTKSAIINIFDATGQLIHSEPIAQMGIGQIEIKAGTIAAGTYSYSLVLDGQILDTKRMVIVK